MRTTILLLSVLFALPALATDQYLCIGEEAVGFKFDEQTNSWNPTDFMTDLKFVVRKSTVDERNNNEFIRDAKWVLSDFGSEELVRCEATTSSENELVFITCGSLIVTKVSLITMRFYSVSATEFVMSPEIIKKFGSGDGGIEIGSCSPF